MAKHESRADRKTHEVVGRIALLLKDLWEGNQRSMAAAVGCSQAALSMVVNGKRAPGRSLVDLIAAFPRVNPVWLRSGEGVPILAPPAADSLPVSEQVLPGPPLECRNLLLPDRYPVTPDNFAETRYWLRLRHNEPAVESSIVKLQTGDRLLIDSDLSRVQLEDFHGLAVVRLRKDEETEIRLCRIWPEMQTVNKTVFNVDPFERGAKRRQLARFTTTVDFPDGTRRYRETFKEVVREQRQGKGVRRWRTTGKPVGFFQKVMDDSLVAVAVQLVRDAPW